jgi:hypothetical protein
VTSSTSIRGVGGADPEGRSDAQARPAPASWRSRSAAVADAPTRRPARRSNWWRS